MEGKLRRPHCWGDVRVVGDEKSRSHYSGNDHGKINVDMLKTVRLIEAMSGEKLVPVQSDDESKMEDSEKYRTSLKAQVEALRQHKTGNSSPSLLASNGYWESIRVSGWG